MPRRVLLSCVFVLVWQLDVFNAKPTRTQTCMTETCLAGLFDENISAIIDADATNIHSFNSSFLEGSMFAALAIQKDGEKTIFYVAERFDSDGDTKIGVYIFPPPSNHTYVHPPNSHLYWYYR